MDGHIFTEISLLLALSAGLAMIMRALRQPLIIGHIFTGILVGPSVLGLVDSPETIEVFGKFGIALLLFIVGLGLNPRIIKEVGRVSLLTGVGQVIFTSALGFVFVRFLGYGAMPAFYISVALAFSSTIIILKLLNDKKEQNKLYGKISIGFLLVQDLIATFALVIAAATGQGGLSYAELGQLAAKGIGIGLLIFMISKFIIKPLTGFLSKSQELLFLFALAWGFAISTLFFELGFSLEVGALIAGVALSTMSYSQEVGSRLRPLRDFFIVVFFIALGAKLGFGNFAIILPQAIFLSVFVLVGNPIIVMVIMGLLGYTRKTSFKAGLAVAQISEFSLIFMLLGQANGQVSDQAVSLVTIVGIITIAVSSYMIIYADGLYRMFERYLRLFERKKVKTEHEIKHTYDAVLFGYKKGGSEFIRVFPTIAKRFIVVDYDPDVIDELERKQTPYLYGDVTDLELLEEIDLSKVRLVVSLIGDHPTNVFLLRHLEQVNPHAVVICRADTAPEAAELYGLGASYVMMPAYIGSEKISAFIRRNGFNKTEFRHYREKHIQYLQTHYEAPMEA
jgi:Kef-type K+ transport system membrane component KefB/Trk K+ transport system NAD-binding subunit